ncbi:uncharacterized protein LOC141914556 isoform X2 [Tubulanus polymorphus]|uniref:uncharacterized protein LOC141914556 isoform X2 n=1 Tax=Tubulanus polymorphus TaxID=672921 RepID=UPI003DA33652
MAASGKKKKSKGKTLHLNEFLGDESDSPGISLVLQNKTDWATEMENEDIGGESMDMDYGISRPTVNRALLPSAPKSALGPTVDMAKVPTKPPFTAFLGNLPYDVDEESIHKFFSKFEVLSVRLPADGGRRKGFGYAEFADRQSLIAAIDLNDEMLLNRKIRVDLASNQESGGGGFGGGGRGETDRSDEASDWRSRPMTDDSRNDDRFSSRGRDDDRGGFGGRDRGYGGDRDRGYGGDRDRGYGGDRDRGYGGDRDRGYGGDRDRGYGGDRDRGYGGDRDRGYGGDRDRGYGGDRDRGYGGSRGYGGDRDGGYGRDRRDGRGFGGGFRGDRYRDRYNDSRDDRYGGSGGNRDDRYSSNREGGGEGPKERPRLNLAPRSKQTDDGGAPSEENRTASSSIFGSARPIDTASREREIEKKLESPAVAPPQQTEPKKSSDSIFGSARPVDTAAREREIEERLERMRLQTGPGAGAGAGVGAGAGAGAGENKENDSSSTSNDNSEREKPRFSSRDIRLDEDYQEEIRRHEERRRGNRDNSPVSDRGGRQMGYGKGVLRPVGRRKDSENSNHSDVDGVHQSEDSNKSSARQAPSRKEETVLVPAPPPAENPWTKRKTVSPSSQQQTVSPNSQQAAPPQHTPQQSKSETPPSAGTAENTKTGQQNAWTRGERDNAWGSKSRDLDNRNKSAWNKRDSDNDTREYHRDGGRAPRGRGAWARGGSASNNTAPPPKQRKERPLPKSIDEMPKYEGTKAKDFSVSNKFAQLLDGNSCGSDSD